MNESLRQFETMFGPVILQRGKDYFEEGRVQSVSVAGKGVKQIQAAVEGSQLYRVRITLNGKNRILTADCDCPYRWDAHCKHQAAVLFALRARLLPGQAESRRARVPKLAGVKKPSRRRRKRADKDTALWRTVARAQSKDARTARAGRQKAKKRMEALLDAAYATQVTRFAVSLCLMVLSASESMHTCACATDFDPYDFGGRAVEHIGELIDGCLCYEAEQEWDALTATVLDWIGGMPFQYLQERLVLCLLPLCSSEESRRSVESYLDRLERINVGWRDDQSIDRIMELRLRLIETVDGDQAAERFALNNLWNDNFRKNAIFDAKSKQDYEAVLALAREGLRKDNSVMSAAWEWERFAFDAHKALGEVAEARGLARGFLLNNRFEYYQWFKESAEAAGWRNELEGLLGEMETLRFCHWTYERILVEEEMWNRLMAHAERRPEDIFTLYEHLEGRFAERVDAAFRRAILDTADTDPRNHDLLSARLKIYASVCGQDAAESLRDALREDSRRKADLRIFFPGDSSGSR